MSQYLTFFTLCIFLNSHRSYPSLLASCKNWQVDILSPLGHETFRIPYTHQSVIRKKNLPLSSWISQPAFSGWLSGTRSARLHITPSVKRSDWYLELTREDYSVLHLGSGELCSKQKKLGYLNEANTHLCSRCANLRRNLKHGFTSHYLQNNFHFWGQLDWSQSRLQLTWTLKSRRKNSDMWRT